MASLPPATDSEPQAARAWALAVTGNNLEAEVLLRDTSQTVSAETGLHHAGAAAWLRDQTADAIRLLDAARNASADPAIPPPAAARWRRSAGPTSTPGAGTRRCS